MEEKKAVACKHLNIFEVQTLILWVYAMPYIGEEIILFSNGKNRF